MNTVAYDFFDLSTNNGEPVRTAPRFGLCDDDCDENKEKPAYSDVGFSEKWIATVQNPNNIEIQFYAIDKRIKIFITGNEQSLCDGMLRFSDSLYLVELKVKQKKWASEAVDQLKNTIVFLKQYHASELAQLRTKKAYACNRKHPNFPYSRRDQIRRFYNETGFRLDIQATINIK